jgi:hypothetical protein
MMMTTTKNEEMYGGEMGRDTTTPTTSEWDEGWVTVNVQHGASKT